MLFNFLLKLLLDIKKIAGRREHCGHVVIGNLRLSFVTGRRIEPKFLVFDRDEPERNLNDNFY